MVGFAYWLMFVPVVTDQSGLQRHQGR